MATTTHISYLDTIRGLAALAVISEHFVIAYGLPCQSALCERILDFSPAHIWWDGTAAVSMFFVLSGFVLSLKYFPAGQSPDIGRFELDRFLIGRVCRIWLPYLLVLAISAGLFALHFDRPSLSTRLAPSAWIVDMWHRYPLDFPAMLREAFLPKLPELIVLLPQAWTLSIELVLSLLLPLGLLLSQRGTAWLLFFSTLATGLLGVSLFLWHFVLGLTLARYHLALETRLRGRRPLRYLLLLCGLLLYTSDTLFTAKSVGENTLWLGTGLGAGLILAVFAASPRWQNLLSVAALRQIGRVSYSAYLTHMAVLINLTPHLLIALEHVSHNRLLLWFGGWLGTIITVQGLSLVFYHVLEIPSMVLGRRLAEALRPHRSLTPPPISSVLPPNS
ncbi:acyltransferase family protein [Methylomonas sp. HW2-6]|uniref:acyltransferase family protein n=1 Tax=Methylomonas sp. HW2-6 TaxID=3376687 RepID=UPI00404259ED